ncbi:MAG: MFS transporter [Chloroflexia bacterium]
MRTDERAAANASAQPAAGLGRATVPPEATKAVGPLMFAPLRYREYRLLLSGAIVTQTGHWMQQVAQGWLMLLLTDSAFYLGLLGFARGIPMLVLSLPAGVAIDRLNRRRLLMGMQAGAALVAISMAVLTVTGLVEAWHLIAAALIGGSFASVIFPTRQALVPTLVPTDELRRAVALNSAGQNSTRIAGPSIAGVVIALVGVGGASCCRPSALYTPPSSRPA